MFTRVHVEKSGVASGFFEETAQILDGDCFAATPAAEREDIGGDAGALVLENRLCDAVHFRSAERLLGHIVEIEDAEIADVLYMRLYLSPLFAQILRRIHFLTLVYTPLNA